MENTATAILAGLAAMLVVAALVAGLVWLTYHAPPRGGGDDRSPTRRLCIP